MQAAEIMQTDLVTCPPELTVADAARVMNERGVGACLVMDGPLLAGVFTERDLLRLVASGEDVRGLAVSGAMTRSVTTAPPDADLLWVADTMRRLHVRHLPVASEDGMVVGIVSLRDLFAAAEAVLRLDPRGAEAAREVLAAAGR
jgi:CBS domain-containing protein